MLSRLSTGAVSERTSPLSCASTFSCWQRSLAKNTIRAAELWRLYQPLAEAVDAYRDALDERDLRTIVDFLEFANETMAEATRHARSVEAEPPAS